MEVSGLLSQKSSVVIVHIAGTLGTHANGGVGRRVVSVWCFSFDIHDYCCQKCNDTSPDCIQPNIALFVFNIV